MSLATVSSPQAARAKSCTIVPEKYEFYLIKTAWKPASYHVRLFMCCFIKFHSKFTYLSYD